MDTGIDLNHPAFAGKLVPGYDFVDNDNNPSEVGVLHQNPSYGHGTHVAGIVLLTAPNVKIMPLRVLDANGEGNLWRIKDAMIFAAQNGAQIVNMSFGYPQDFTSQSNTFLHDLFQGCDSLPNAPGQQQFPELDNRIMLVVTGAGNGGQIVNGTTIGTRRIFPGAERGITPADNNGIDDNLLNVGASTRYDELALFSTMAHVTNNDDRWVRTVAPGENIVSTLPGGRYGVWSGTSMSAPIVSGIAALVLQVRPVVLPNRTMSEVVDEIEETGFSWECVVPSRSINMKTTRIDALRAVMNDQTPTTTMPAACQN